MPVRSWLLILPLEHNGRHDRAALDIYTAMHRGWMASMERAMGLYSSGDVINFLCFQVRFDDPDDFPALADAARRAYSWYTPTHLFHGSYEEKDGQWIIGAKLITESGDRSTTMTVTAGNDLEAAAMLLGWLAEPESGITMKDQTRAAMARPILGPDALSTTNGLGAELLANVMDPRWESIMRSGPAARERRLYAIRPASAELAKAVDPGPLDDSASALDHFTRASVALVLKDTATWVHEGELLIARYPGCGFGMSVWNGWLFKVGMRRQRYLHGAEKWFERVGKSNPSQRELAYAYIRGASDWRGTKLAYQITPRAWENAGQLRDAARPILDDLMRTEFVHPIAGSMLLDLLGSTEGARGAAFEGAHANLVGRYPDYIHPWSVLLNYSLPQWGGSEPEVVRIIDRAMAVSPDNPGFGILAIAHYMEAATPGPGDRRPTAMLPIYLANRPEATRQVEEAKLRLLAPGHTIGHAVNALSASILTEDWVTSLKVLEMHPDIHNHILKEMWNTNFYNRVMYFTFFLHTSVGNTRQALEIMDIADRDDELDLGIIPPAWGGHRIFRDQQIRGAFRLYAITLADPSEENLRRSDEAFKLLKNEFHLLMTRVLTGKIRDEDALRLEQLSEEDPAAPDYEFMLAIIQHQKGNEELAEQHADSAMARLQKSHVNILTEIPARAILGRPTQEELRDARKSRLMRGLKE